MTYIKGEDINLGVARETVRGTAEAPSAWVPGRAPVSVAVKVEKTQIKETRGTGMSSQGSVVSQIRAEGELEFNVRNGSIVYFLLSLLGKVTSVANGTAYDHTLEILTGNPQHPTLTLALSQLGQQDYRYPKCLVKSLELSTPVDDLVNAKVSFVGVDEEEVSDYTPAFQTDDYFFRHYDVTIKLATNVAGLSVATPIKLKEMSVAINNNGRVNQNISELNPGDVLGIMQEISGSFKADYIDETYHDIYKDNDYKALQITLENEDVILDAGSSGDTDDIHPKIVITLPKISFTNWQPDRPIDDIVSEGIDYMAHYSEDDGYGIQVVVTNEEANYN